MNYRKETIKRFLLQVCYKTVGLEGCHGIHMGWTDMLLNQSRTCLFIFEMIKEKYLAAFLSAPLYSLITLTSFCLTKI